MDELKYPNSEKSATSKEPKLRFEGFVSPWLSINLIEVSLDILSNGVFNNPSLAGRGYRIINVKDMYNEDVIDTERLEKVDINKADFIKNQSRFGDIFFTRSSLVKEGIAHSNVLLSTDQDITYDGHLIRLRPDLSRYDPFFLSKLLRTVTVRRQLVARGKTGTMTTIGQQDVATVRVSCPCLSEQKKIAQFLSVVDARVSLLHRRYKSLCVFKKGMMQRIFSRELRFTRDDGAPLPDWEERRLGEITISHSSGIYKKKGLYGRGCNIVGVSDLFSISVIRGQEFRRVPLSNSELEENCLNEGDILYAESSLVRGGIAKSVYVNEAGAGTAFAWHTRRFRIDGYLAIPSFVYFYLESSMARRYIESVATQTALTGITTKDYFACPIDLPSLEEQQKISDFLSALDEKIDAVAKAIGAMQRFKKGLLQQMFV